MKSAHDLDDHADLEVIDNVLKILGKAVGDRAVGEFTQVENLFDVNFFANTGEEFLFVGQQNFSYAGTDDAVTHDCY